MLQTARPATPRTPRGVPTTVMTFAQKYEHVRKLQKTDNLFREFPLPDSSFSSLNDIFHNLMSMLKNSDSNLCLRHRCVLKEMYFQTLAQISCVCLITEKLIKDFRKFKLGPRTACKDKENSRQAASHALRFCLFMAAGLPQKAYSTDMKFLLQTDKLCSCFLVRMIRDSVCVCVCVCLYILLLL